MGLSGEVSERLSSRVAKQRLVAASSRRTPEKVPSRKGSGRHWRRASRARALSLSLQNPISENDLSERGWKYHTGESSEQHALVV
jgi:hypothetical protein